MYILSISFLSYISLIYYLSLFLLYTTSSSLISTNIYYDSSIYISMLSLCILLALSYIFLVYILYIS